MLAVLIDDRVPLAERALERWTPSDPGVLRIFVTSLVSNSAATQRREATAGEIPLRKPLRADTLFEALSPGGTRRPQPRTPLPQRIFTPLPDRGTVLRVDDNYVSLRAAEIHLQNLGCTVITAVDGVQAMQCMSEGAFSFIILDVQLADVAAGQILTALRGGDGPNRDTPVIGMSATTSPEAIATLRATGMDDFLAKPVTANALEALVERWTD